MTDRSAGRVAALAVAIAILGLFLLTFSRVAIGHETMGHFEKHGVPQYLYGIRVDASDNLKVNCCKYRGDGQQEQEGAGDCRKVADKDVKIVPGGFVWEGDFIPYARTNISPVDPVDGEYYFYACKHPKGSYWGDNPKPHCFFHPPNGS
jgi:hypothetical protein